MVGGDDSDDVLSHLPKTRPARRSARRATAGEGAPATPKTASKRAPSRPKATAAKAAPKPAAKAKPKAARPKAKPAPPPAPAPPPERRPIEPPSAGEIAQSAVQAASDLAHVGLAIGREALRAARSKLPRL